MVHHGGGAPAGAYAHRLNALVEAEVLAGLSAELQNFVLLATTCERLNESLANALVGSDRGANLLGQCLQRGLFLSQYIGPDGRSVYRWQAAFAQACQSVARGQDHARVMRAHAVAAEYLRDVYPLEAVMHALQADRAELAWQILTGCWVELVIGGEVGSLDLVCRDLPIQLRVEPEILAIRAVCHDVWGDRGGSAELLAQALAAMPEPRWWMKTR